jgi:protein arginine kinase activator
MLCDICHKREALLFYTLVINSQKTELRLCESCAAKKGLIDSVNSLDPKDFIPLLTHDSDIANLKCNRCGLTYKQFMSVTKFGCSDCYKAFRKEVKLLVRRIHGSDEHIGKSVSKGDRSDTKEFQLYEMRKRLKDAVSNESYEEAARLRDDLRKLREDGSRGDGQRRGKRETRGRGDTVRDPNDK